MPTNKEKRKGNYSFLSVGWTILGSCSTTEYVCTRTYSIRDGRYKFLKVSQCTKLYLLPLQVKPPKNLTKCLLDRIWLNI